jgi:4-amino-4-deoxy-L-arabinose transferase-like glycosyltransferase
MHLAILYFDHFPLMVKMRNEKITATRTNLLLMGSIGLNTLLFVIFLVSRHYPPLLMLLHIISLVVLWGVVLYRLQVRKLIAGRGKELLLILALVTASVCVGLYKVEELTPGMYGDEISVGAKSVALVNRPEWLPFVGEHYSHPTPLLYMTAASIHTLGHTLTAVRLPSILFGALAVGVLYLLLRVFFPVPIAGLGAVLLVFQYTHVVLQRLAYEPPASLFCQIVALLFLVLYHQRKERVYLLGEALALGAGMYTYLNFRAFALVVFLLTLFLILRAEWKKHMREAVVFAVLVFVAVMPLMSYVIRDPQGFWGRPADISIFSRHLSTPELFKELGSAALRTLFLPFVGIPGAHPPFIGDPNPGKNPAGFTIFDPVTTLLAVLGFVYLFKKKRPFFWGSLLLFIPPLMSDIFSSEFIPEFHYYGLGHPNALRVSGLIAVILLAATFGIYWLYTSLHARKFNYTVALLGVVVGLISIGNGALYFAQTGINHENYIFNYVTNGADVLQMVTSLNHSGATKIGLTKALASNERVAFFLDSAKDVSTFPLTSAKDILGDILHSDATAIDINEQTVSAVNQILTGGNLESLGYTVQEIQAEGVEQPRIIIFEKSSPNDSMSQ